MGWGIITRARAGSRCARFYCRTNIHIIFCKKQMAQLAIYNIIEWFWRRGKSLWGGTLASDGAQHASSRSM